MLFVGRKKEVVENSGYLKRQEELRKELIEVQKELERASMNFSYVVEPELIDSCIYELNAGQLKYQFLMKQMKENLKEL